MTWVLENWFMVTVGSAYLVAVAMAYIYGGRYAALAVATIGVGHVFYQHGRNVERDHYQDHVDEIERSRADAYDEIDGRGTDAGDVGDRLRDGRY